MAMTAERDRTMEIELETPKPAPARRMRGNTIDIEDLGDRLRVTVEFPIGADEVPSRRRALAKAWEALAAAISEAKAKLPPVPVPKRPARKRTKVVKGTRTGSGSWWQF
jgi:hypothetical protein